MTQLADLSFEAAMKELEAIVRKLEGGQGDLEGSITDYARGVELKEHCQKKLADAKLKVEKVIAGADGGQEFLFEEEHARSTGRIYPVAEATRPTGGLRVISYEYLLIPALARQRCSLIIRDTQI